MADVAQQSQKSSGSTGRRPGSRSRSNNPQQQLSTIEKSVTHLLVATKQLLETLTQWARGNASEGEVSDVYVRLGYEFNIACRAFSAIGVDTTDLGPVPDLLRAILEDTLSQPATQASLDKYLPRIRDIIINLLQGLKRKQQRLRPREGTKDSGELTLPRHSSVTRSEQSGENAIPHYPGPPTDASNRESSLTHQLEEFPTRTGSVRPYDQESMGAVSMPDLPPRTSSGSGHHSPHRTKTSPQNSMHQPATRESVLSDSASSSVSTNHRTARVLAPYPEADIMPPVEPLSDPEPPPPQPPPKQMDALSALQKGGELERRASRRFSAYHLQKHLGTSMSGIAAIPPAQNSPIPNRGRDARESLSAVRSRGNTYTRTRSKNQLVGGQDVSPNRQHDVRRISEGDESAEVVNAEPKPPPKVVSEDGQDYSPMIKTPPDKLGQYPFPQAPASPEKFSATINGPLADEFIPHARSDSTKLHRTKSTTPARSTSHRTEVQTPPPTPYVPENSPQAGKELTLFLQYKSKIKKFVLPDGGDLSIPRLQLAFIEKFAWNTQNNGADLPEIYIQDQISGVRHELENLSDIKERSVLVLNVEPLDEVKRHIDDGLGGLRKMVEGLKSSMENHQSALQRVSDRQQETSRELASLASAPPPPSTPRGALVRSLSKDKTGQLMEVQSLRRDLAVVRQTYASLVAQMDTSMAEIRTKAASFKEATATTSTPAVPPSNDRAYVDRGKKQLSEDSEKIVNRVDDLQDVVEDLRKDVVSRGVRPLPRQLEQVSREISTATADLKKLQQFLKREKPIWTKIWEKELQIVCDDRDLLTLQEELAVDLEDDLEKAAATFALVEQATKQQTLNQPDGTGTVPGGPNMPNGGLRSTSRTIAVDPGADPRKTKDSVLGEVRALQPNHESRLEAIERAERARARELSSRKGDEFQRELGAFVDENRLKKTGGIDEVERMRKIREEKARTEVQERQAQRMREKAEKEAAAAAATATAAAASTSTTNTNEGSAEAAVPDGPSADDPQTPAININGTEESTSTGGNEIFVEKKRNASAPTLELQLPGPLEGAQNSVREEKFEDAKEDVSQPDGGSV